MQLCFKVPGPLSVAAAFVGCLFCCYGWGAAEAGDEDSLLASLRSIDKRAIKARDRKDLQLVEDLRLERLALIRAAAPTKGDANSVWIRGSEAIQRAEKSMRAMRYREACQQLVEAWKPFAEPRPGEPVFGDIATTLFRVAQAAIALHPDFLRAGAENPVSEQFLLEALQTAVKSDPCQVEATAMLAFFEKPKPEEAFLPADQRPSLRERNRTLLDISPPKDMDWKFVPWFAPAEFLKAQSSSFVLDDLSYYTNFLNERGFRLKGVDRFGEPFQVVLGGALLVFAPEGGGRSKKLAVARFLPDTKQWQKVRLQLLVVQSADVGDSVIVDEEASLRRIADVGATFVQMPRDELEREVREKVERIADGFEKIVQAHAKKILELNQGLDERLNELERGFDRYGERFPAHVVQSREAQQQIAELRELIAKDRMGRQMIEEALMKLPVKPEPNEPQAAAAQQVNDSPPKGLDSINSWFETRVNTVRLLGQQLQKAGAAPPGFDTLVGAIAMTTMLRRNHAICPMLIDLVRMEKELCDQEIEKIIQKVPGIDLSPERKRQLELRRRNSAELQKQFETYKSIVDSALVGSFLRIPYRKVLQSDELVTLIRRISQEAGAQAVADAYVGDATESALGFERIKVLEALALELRTQKPLGGRPREFQGLKWAVYDLPDGLAPEVVADAIDSLPRLGLNPDVDLLEVLQNAESDPRRRRIALKTVSELTNMSGCPIGVVSKDGGEWEVQAIAPRDLLEPSYVMVLMPEEPVKAAGFGPAFSVDDAGENSLLLQYDGETVPFRLDDQAPQPTLTAAFPARAEKPCIDGVLRLQIGGGARLVRDARQNKVTRLEEPEAERFYRIVSDGGRELSDRSVNYAKKDWRGLDRNIVNEFMPRVMVEHVSLPAWRSYRSELQRRSPDGQWIWALPRQAFNREGFNSEEARW